MISIKDYAKQNNVTYEAVRQQIKRYREQLDDHIIQDGRTQYLDDIAVTFLDERRQKNPVVVYQQGKDETIEAMRLELEGAYKKIAAQAVMITELQQFKIDTMERRQELEDARTAQERRERELKTREDGFAQELAAARQEASEAAQAEAEKEKKILEGFIKDSEKARGEDAKEYAQKLAEKDKKIQELENRNIWHYLTAPFRKKGKQDGTEN